jgi:DNA-binding response OmpR family regulator
MARVRAVMRRITNADRQKKQVLAFKDLYIDLDDFIVRSGDQTVPLTKKEVEILWTLASNKGRVFTRDNLLNSLWGYDYYGDSRTVDSHIKRLRAKLDVTPHDGWEIKTIWGVGYKFEEGSDEK